MLLYELKIIKVLSNWIWPSSQPLGREFWNLKNLKFLGYESDVLAIQSKYVFEFFIAANRIVYGSIEFPNIARSITVYWATKNNKIFNIIWMIMRCI